MRVLCVVVVVVLVAVDFVSCFCTAASNFLEIFLATTLMYPRPSCVRASIPIPLHRAALASTLSPICVSSAFPSACCPRSFRARRSTALRRTRTTS